MKIVYKPAVLRLIELGCKCFHFHVFAVALPSEHVAELSEMKSLISDLYSRLHVDEFQIETEKRLITQLEDLKVDLAPLEKVSKAR